MKRLLLVFSAVVLVFAAHAGAAAAAYIVDVTYDAPDAFVGDSKCDDGTGHCTLRAAVQEANHDGLVLGVPWTDIDVPSGVFQLTVLGAGEDLAATGDLDVLTGMGIIGKGTRRTIIDGLRADRVLDVHKAALVTDSLAIRGGREKAGAGIGARDSWLDLRTSALYVNDAAYGGGIFAYDSSVSLYGVTFFDNTASQMGGALFLRASGTPVHAKLANVTIHANASRNVGGGIYTGNVPTALLNTTIANNRAAVGGGLYWAVTPPESYNTIVAYNGVDDCNAAIIDAANNLDTDTTCGFVGPGSFSGVDPFLDGLAYLGGGPFPTPNWVRPLLPWSPAIDTGDPGTCLGNDERGELRPVGATCDIGAYEFS
jgi:hypothetical protein